jgi:hypothetical protein
LIFLATAWRARSFGGRLDLKKAAILAGFYFDALKPNS